MVINPNFKIVINIDNWEVAGQKVTVRIGKQTTDNNNHKTKQLLYTG